MPRFYTTDNTGNLLDNLPDLQTEILNAVILPWTPINQRLTGISPAVDRETYWLSCYSLRDNLIAVGARMLRKKELLDKIAGKLAHLKACVELHNELRYFDLNIACEDFFASLLNCVYGYSLTNLNHDHNSVAIDLGDSANQIAVQVTSERRKAKVQSTIDCFAENGLDARFKTLKILIIGNRTGDYSNLRLPKGLGFNGKADVIDIPRLMRDIRELSTSHLEEVALLLQRETSNDNHTANASAHHAMLDMARDLVNSDKPYQALTFLLKQRPLVWGSASTSVKARLLGLLAMAQCRLGENSAAATSFIQARQYAPDDEQVLCNVALGYYLLGEKDSAVALSNQVLERNPANFQARSILIQLSNAPLDELINTLPAFARDNHEVAFAVASLAQRRHDLSNAVKWFEVAIGKSEGQTPQVKGYFGEALLHSFTASPASPVRVGQIDTTTRTRIEYAAALLKEACDAYTEDEVLRTHITWLMNGATACRLLDDAQGANSFLNHARRLNPTHPLVIHELAFEASNRGDFSAAIELVKSIKDTASMPDQPLLLGQLLLDNGQFSAAAEILQAYLAANSSEKAERDSQLLLAEIYMKCERAGEALHLVEGLLESRPGDIYCLVTASQIYRKLNRRNDAEESLERGVQAAVDGSPSTHLLQLANELAAQHRWDDSADILERIVCPTQDSPLTRNLLIAYFHSSRLEKALTLCKTLRASKGPLETVTEFEIAILEEIGNVKEARLVVSEFIGRFPEATTWRVQFAVLCFRENDLVALDAMLESPPDWKAMPVRFGQQLAQLLWIRNRSIEAIDLLYEMRRVHSVGSVQLQYLQTMLLNSERQELPSPDLVQLNTAVSVKDSAGNCQWYIIEVRDDADNSKGELQHTHQLAQKLLGKSVGSSIVLKESPFSTEAGTIVAIVNKYVHAFQETAQGYEIRYPDTGGFISMNFENGQNGFDELCNRLKGQHDKRLELEETAETRYRSNPLTVGSLAQILRLNVIQAWAQLTNKKGPGVICSTSSPADREAEASQFENSQVQFLIDPVALMTIHGIQIADEVATVTGRLGIAQTTIDLITELMHKKVRISRRRFITMRTSAESANSIVSQAGAELSLESILEWVRVHCTVLPWSPANASTREARKELEEVLGTESLETILCACVPGRALYSDDLRLRMLAKHEFGVDSISTNGVLLQLIKKEIIDLEKYHKAVVQMASAGYCNIGVSAPVLLEAAKQSRWASDGSPFTDVLWLLHAKASGEDSAICVVADFARLLWDTSVLPMTTNCLMFRLLDEVATGRNPFRVTEKLLRELSVRFEVIPLAALNFSKLVLMWRRLRT